MSAPPPARACRRGSRTGRSPSTARRSGGRRHARRSATSWPSRCPMPRLAASWRPKTSGSIVLYEDEHLLALDKPAGIVVHPGYRNTEGTVMNALLWHARGWPASQRPSLVGRLDKLTSGVVIVAKTAAIHAALQRALASSRSEKDYLAVVYGRVNVARGEIDLRLGPRSGRSAAGRRVRDRRRAEPHAIRAAGACGGAARGALAAALPARDRPDAPDPRAPRVARLAARRRSDLRRAAVVRGRRSRRSPRCSARFPRQALHAWRVGLIHPITGARLEIEAPVPDDLEELLKVSGLPSGSAAIWSGGHPPLNVRRSAEPWQAKPDSTYESVSRCVRRSAFRRTVGVSGFAVTWALARRMPRCW